ncbi:MAG: hypothetical protein OXL95_11495 [Nitrospira sp.]|nr:hypothetical protein [Nitrospira sp.]
MKSVTVVIGLNPRQASVPPTHPALNDYRLPSSVSIRTDPILDHCHSFTIERHVVAALNFLQLLTITIQIVSFAKRLDWERSDPRSCGLSAIVAAASHATWQKAR